jgi:hypothetical protein
MIERGSRRNFAYEPIPTTLHFKAHWRKSLDPALSACAAMANTAVWWPAALKVPVGPHESEQAAISRALEDRTWIDRARRGVTLVIERLAWEHTTRCLHLGHGVSEEVAALRALLTYRESQLADLAQQVNAAIDAAPGSAVSRSPEPPDFVEQDYLAANPDVAEAVARGDVQSAFDHWIRHGWRERRSLRPGAGAREGRSGNQT